MRKLILAALLAGAGLAGHAQPTADYPARPIKFVLISAAGSGGEARRGCDPGWRRGEARRRARCGGRAERRTRCGVRTTGGGARGGASRETQTQEARIRSQRPGQSDRSARVPAEGVRYTGRGETDALARVLALAFRTAMEIRNAPRSVMPAKSRS